MDTKTEDRRIRKTRRQLRQALTSLMKEKSVKDITVRELSELCDINRGTFYAHYANVFDMVDKIESEMVAHLNNALDAAPGKPKYAAFCRCSRKSSHLWRNMPDMCLALLGKNGDIAFLDKLKKRHTGKNASLNGGSQYPGDTPQTIDYAYAYAVSGCTGLLKLWLECGMRESPAQMAAFANHLILSGVTLPGQNACPGRS